MRRSVLAVFAAVIATATAVLGAPAAQAAPRPAVVPDYQPPPISWGACDNAGLRAAGAECGFVQVPLDYAKPDAATIQLAVSRIKHRVPDAQAQGPMLVNPGGPGGPGLTLSRLGSLVPDHAGDYYDWIGFDPRGVGASKPRLSCIPDYGGFGRPDYDPVKSPQVTDIWLAKAKAYAQACAHNGGDLLSHLTTIDSARDMDSIRKALGASQINYYGFSYGTYLGQVYGTLFPDRLRRVVFDGVVDQRGIWYKDNLDQDVAFDKNIQIYFDWVAKYDAIYHLGASGEDVEKLYYQVQDQLRAQPQGGVGPAEWTDIFLQAGYYVFGWEQIATTFSDWVHKHDVAELKAAYASTASLDDDNNYAIYLAVQCTDTQWPQSWERIKLDSTRIAKKAPFETWANTWYNAPCSYWPAPAHQPVTINGSKVASALLIEETHDAATPFPGALEARKLFPNSVLVEGVGGTTHAGSLSGVACTDDTVAAYLADGTLPPRVPGTNRSDKQCDPVPQPAPTALTPTPAPAPSGASAPGGARS